jgi:hypothetical protein
MKVLAVPVRLLAYANAALPAEHTLHIGNEPRCAVEIRVVIEFFEK